MWLTYQDGFKVVSDLISAYSYTIDGVKPRISAQSKYEFSYIPG